MAQAVDNEMETCSWLGGSQGYQCHVEVCLSQGIIYHRDSEN